MKPIAFIIITYNRPDDTLELLQNIASMEKAGELLEEVILVNNASTADYSVVERYIADNRHLPFRYYNAGENLGVARGRNFAIDKSSAPILIMLDDDAVLQNKDALIRLLEEFEKKDTSRPKAIVSFKVLYYDTLEMQKNALPHKQFDQYKDKAFFETYYYAGGAHAIRREALEKVGNYPTDFFYGMEEYDLSYRLLDAGYSIVFSDAVVMLHKESPLGRKPKAEKIREMWVNKTKVAWRYLPKKYFYSTALMWSMEYLRKIGFDLKGFLKGWKEIGAISKKEKRRPISSDALHRLKSVSARLWY
ncbi:glycosyltransferase family 2 protein [Flavisolibacter nicotianae]|uniref:glycosyltransferase family 2 protein n=1 Tax=Flavisolibacter nicotianae TaxID=2364882 RepID=UPI000EB2EF50|nr:glycosyltransferase family 2 protein [Flavisolibacter nicotianae]